jgi:hypothetical protein
LANTEKPGKRTPKAPPRNEIIARVTRNGTLIETLYDETQQPQCRFVISEPNKPPVEAQEYSLNGITVYPPERLAKLFEQATVKLPSALEDYGSVPELFDSIKSFLRAYLDLDEFHISLLATYAAMTHLYDAFRAFPYLRFKGEPATGKSRMIQTVGAICYRAVDLGVSPSRSALFRRADQMRSTLLLDEADFDGDLRSDYIKLLNSGYVTHGTVSISVGTDGDYVPQSFATGCPKIIGNRLAFPDRALETRVLTIPTLAKALPDHIPVELPYRFEGEALSLRNRLMKYRLDTFHHIRKEEASLRGLDGRTIQLGLPLYSLSPDPAWKSEFLRYLKARSKEQREDDPLQVVLEAILKAHSPTFTGDKVSVARISEEARNLARERELAYADFSPRRTAELVRSLQFRTVRWSAGYMAIVDEETLAMQVQRYGLKQGSAAGVQVHQSGRG